MAASSSASSSGWRYEVFLNFRGVDTRNGFTGHLYNGLDGAKIRTFIDSEQLHVGENIGGELLSAIQESKISIPIFSKNYASSKWCLNELVKIVECSKTRNQLVLPIFYDVDPSDVRHSTGTYAEALQKHGKRFDQKIIEEWKQALGEVGALKGWDLKNIGNGHEGALVRDVVAVVSSKLIKGFQIISDDLVGIQSHVEEMMSLLNIKSEDEDVKIVGVWGLGGVGKTTITKVVYNTISHYFEGCSFLENVRETSQHCRGLIDLQNQLVSDLLKGESFKITNVGEGVNVISERVCRMKVLIVLDDVDEKFQLDAFIGKRDCVGLGSRIILTTRDAHILVDAKVDKIYEHNEMDPNDALQLFSRHAFRSDQTPDDFLNLSKEIVRITGGLPLALEVIGSSLFCKRESIWQETLKMLQEIPNDKVLKKLQISFDGLTDLEKEIFLDIACFFIGMDKNIACSIWQQCNFYPEGRIEDLRQKSLVKIGENNELKMHDQIRDLGREMVRQEKPKAPGKRSRLWSHKEALDVLEKHTGTNKVEGLCIDLGESSSRQSCLMSEGFAKLTRLRLLQVDYAQFAPDFMPSFSELIWLRWKGCPSEFMLTKFHPVNLVVLDLSYSLVRNDWIGWSYIKVAKNLKVMNLTGCQHLSTIPKLGNNCLEVLILENCVNLVEIDESINFLERLITLNMRGCVKLRNLPYGILGLTSLKNLNLHQCATLDKLPDSMATLLNLETFDASFCYIKDGGIPDICLYSLEILRLGGNDFRSLPLTVSRLSSLQTLDLRFCDKLESLPKLPSSLKYLNVLRCRSLRSLPVISNLTNLEVLCLDECENLVEMPALLGLRNLVVLNLDNCHRLTKIGSLVGLDSLELFTMKNCGSLRKIGKMSSLRKLKELKLIDFSMLCEIEGLEGLDSLELLTIKQCKSLIKMPGLFDLKKLRVLEVEDCEEFLETEGLVGLDSLELLTMKRCKLFVKAIPMPRSSLYSCHESMGSLLNFSNLRNLKHLSIVKCDLLVRIQSRNGLKSSGTLHLRSRNIKTILDVSNLRNLKHLSIGCNRPSHLLEINGLYGLESIETLDIWSQKIHEVLDLSSLRNLKRLSIVESDKLRQIQVLDELESLETLVIRGCLRIERLQDLSNLRNLKHLSIVDCPLLKEAKSLDKLESLLVLDIVYCGLTETLWDLSGLRNLKHLSCSYPEKIQGLDRLKSLETLVVRWGIFIKRLQDFSNLSNLKRLSIIDCCWLKDIQILDRLESLETLEISRCGSLERLWDLSNLRNLKNLSIVDCDMLKKIEGLDRVESLEALDIQRCRYVETLPDLQGLRVHKRLRISSTWET